MNKYQLTTEKKKLAIIDAAAALFREQGFQAVHIQDIAALAGVSQVSIYNYFGSKEALIEEIVLRIMQQIFIKAENILKSQADFKEKIEAALSLCTEEVPMTVSECFTEQALQDSALTNLLLQHINAQKQIVYKKYIEAGKQDGAIDARLDTDTILEFIAALNQIDFIEAVPNQAVEKTRQLHQLFLNGILG